jgi:predicted alpha/beta superfamily hydrolase
MNKLEKVIGGRDCCIYEYGSGDRLLIQPVDDHDLEVLDNEAAMISELSCGAGFKLAAFRVNDWNTDLSPWEAPPVFGNEGFGNGAEDTLSYVIDELIPALSMTPATKKYIGGYSLAGFFSLWAAYQTDLFSGIAAASPSVWFPGWIEYAGSHSVSTPLVYLSLGDKEPKTRNAVMKTVGDNINRQLEILREDSGCTECILEMNQGNHFKEPDLRTAKGFAWLLKKE